MAPYVAGAGSTSMSDAGGWSSSASAQEDQDDDPSDNGRMQAAGGSERERATEEETVQQPRTSGLKLKLNVRPAAAASAGGDQGMPQRKRMRMDESAPSTPAAPATAASKNGTGTGLKLKLNVRPVAASPAAHDPAGDSTPAPSRSIKLKLGSLSAPMTSPHTPVATPMAGAKIKSKSKKAPTLASPYPSPGGSPGGSPSPAGPAKRSHKKKRPVHPLASEVRVDQDVPHGPVGEQASARQPSRTPGPAAARDPSAAPASAIPAYLQPASHAPDSPGTDSAPATPSRSPSSPAVKLEDEDSDPISRMYDSVAPVEDGAVQTPQPDTPQEVHWNTKGQKGRPYLRIKRPLREIVKRILVDLRRKDQYGLFMNPVSEQDYPGYTAAIGGPDQAMDLSTIERKAEERMYQSLEDYKADIDKMVAAAKRFNGEESFPSHEADIVKAYSDRLVERYAHVVKADSPERERASTVVSTGNGGLGTRAATPVVARSVSPPPAAATTQAPQSMVRPVVPPRSTIPEAMLEFPPESLAAMLVGYYMTGGKRQRTKKEARGRERWDEGTWREWHIEGDRNLREAEDASVVMDTFRSKTIELPDQVKWGAYRKPSDDDDPPMPTRTAVHTDYGRLQDLDNKPIARNDGPWEQVRRVTMGKQQDNEAYLRSIETFVAGAERSAGALPQGHLHDHVQHIWRDGFIDSELRQVANKAGREYQHPSIGPFTHLVQEARKRLPVVKDLQTWAAKGPGVDLACLLHEPADFSVGTAPGPGAGAARAAWFERALREAGDQIRDASERRQQSKLAEDESAKLKQLRLHLLSLVKNVPVYELRPMTPAEAAKLPEAVRGLIKIIQ